jgi:hypothetical protein
LLIAVSGGGCDRENQYETEFKENLIDKFFEYKGNHILTINIIRYLQNKNDSTEFIETFVKEYGYPVWQQAVNVYNDGQILLFIPVKNVQLEEIETIWTFKITNEQIRYYPVRKDRVGIEDSWSFDYFTQEVLNQTPKSGVRFEVKDNKPSTRGWVESIHCVQSFAGIEYDGQLVEVSTGWHCWSSMYYVQDVFVMYILDFSGYGSGEDHFYGGGSEDAWNYALAYIIDKYDMGIGLFRQKKGENGFTSLHMKKDTDGIYQVAKCK